MDEKIAVVGLGYVGLPLAVEFARHFPVVGFDVSKKRVAELNDGRDHTLEVDPAELQQREITFTCAAEDLADCTFIIVAVPTPITAGNSPDLSCLESSSRLVGSILKPGMAVVYESTVYPGVTEDECLPILEAVSGLKLGDFQLGYSPERINPGDKEHTLASIIKVVSGHDEAALERIAAVYCTVVDAGVHKAPTIKTAEAAKVIENVQRDLNIALMNELSKIFALLGIQTQDVIDAAATKWNFHRYTPGLVGGHCIGVDPYYLTKCAQDHRYNPEVILSGRRLNDGMGVYVARKVYHMLVEAGCLPQNAHIWVLGITFKENVPDFRNTRAVDVIDELKTFGSKISVWEPMAGEDEILENFGYESLSFDQARDIDAVVLINGHDAFKEVDLVSLRSRMRTPVLWDVKNFFDRAEAEAQGFLYGSL